MKIVEPSSPKAYQLTDKYQLGTLQAEYRDDTHIDWRYAMLLFFIGVVFLYLAYDNLHTISIPSTGDIFARINAVTQNMQTLAFTFIGALTFLGAVSGFYVNIKNLVLGKKHLYISSNGFIVTRNRRAEAIRWEDIEKVLKRTVYSPPKKQKRTDDLDMLPISSYTILLKNGKGHIFLADAGATIEHELTTYLLPQTIAAYDAGKTRDFGWLTLNAEGIQLNPVFPKEQNHPGPSESPYLLLRLLLSWLDRKQTISGLSATTGAQFLPWSKLRMFWIDESKNAFILSEDNAKPHWAILPLNRIANLALCLAIIEHASNNNAESNLDISINNSNDIGNAQPAKTKYYQPSEVYQIGAHVKTYQTRVTRSGNILFGIMTLLSLTIEGSIIRIFVFTFPTFNDPFSSSPFSLALATAIAVPLLFLIGEFSLLFFTLRTQDSPMVTPIRRKIFVDLYIDGFVYREGRQHKIIAWEQIRLVQRQFSKAWKKSHSLYVLQLDNQTQLALKPMIADVQELGTTIEHEVKKQLLPQVLNDYQANKPIIFPGLCITQQYIYNSVEKLPWSQIKEIEIGQEELVIQEVDASGDWLVIPISQLPNVEVLEDLLTHIKLEQRLEMQIIASL